MGTCRKTVKTDILATNVRMSFIYWQFCDGIIYIIPITRHEINQ